MTRSIPDLVSRLDAARLSPDWLQRVTLRVRAYLDANPDRPEAEHLHRVIHLATLAEKAIEQGDAAEAVTAAMGVIQAAWQAELVQGRVVVADGFKKRSGDKNRTKEIVRIRKKRASESNEQKQAIYADYLEMRRQGKHAYAKPLAKKYGLDDGTIRNIVSEAKRAAE